MQGVICMIVLDIYKTRSQSQRTCVGVSAMNQLKTTTTTHELGHVGNRNVIARLNEVASSNAVPSDPVTL